jgi:hypothetical protein
MGINDNLLIAAAKKIPAEIRKVILNEGFIDVAVNVMVANTPMEFLFDAYEEFIDVSGEHDDFGCYLCRDHVLKQWKQMKPHLQQLESDAK